MTKQRRIVKIVDAADTRAGYRVDCRPDSSSTHLKAMTRLQAMSDPIYEIGLDADNESEKAVQSAPSKLAAEKRTTAERCNERLSVENARLNADLARHVAALKVATDALELMASNDPPCDNDGQGCGCCENIAPTALQRIALLLLKP